jgi:hypothetical protein
MRTKAESVNYLRMALALYGIAVDKLHAELIIDTWEAIEKKGAQFSIKDSVQIEWALRKKYRRIEVTAIAKENKKKP